MVVGSGDATDGGMASTTASFTKLRGAAICAATWWRLQQSTPPFQQKVCHPWRKYPPSSLSEEEEKMVCVCM